MIIQEIDRSEFKCSIKPLNVGFNKSGIIGWLKVGEVTEGDQISIDEFAKLFSNGVRINQ